MSLSLSLSPQATSSSSAFTPESEGLFNPYAPHATVRGKGGGGNGGTPGGGSAKDRRKEFLQIKSLSQESALSSASSRGSDSSPGAKIIGGSYSAASGASSRIVASGATPGGAWADPAAAPDHRPRLAQVASALMQAKAAGQLPSALKCVSIESSRQIAGGTLPEEPEGTGAELQQNHLEASAAVAMRRGATNNMEMAAYQQQQQQQQQRSVQQ